MRSMKFHSNQGGMMWLIDVLVSFTRNIRPRIKEWQDKREFIGESIFIELEKFNAKNVHW